MSRTWTRLIRFIAEEDGQVHLGEVDARQVPDVGLAVLNGEQVIARLITGSIFDGVVTYKTLHVSRLLSPLSAEETPLIRCMGLNYRDHAREANMPIPDVPVLFIKPRTALNGPHPAKINVPKIAQDGSSDYEAELSVVLSKTGRDIAEEDAMSYVLGYTASNDVSARTQQFMNSQWCFSKGFDGSCPLGPVLVASSELDPHQLDIKAIHNGQVVQDSNTCEMIFSIPKIISFLSQGTTLERGTVIMTGTGPGIGAMRNPKVVLKDGDDMRVQIEGIGTLCNRVYYDDRTFPHCLVCEQIGQSCTYPAGPLKPGPKIGSLRRKKRSRNKLNDLDDESPANPEWLGTTRTQSARTPVLDVVVDGEEVEVEADGPDDDTSPTAEVKTLDLSFILHPSHEPSPPNRELVTSPEEVSDSRSEDTLRQARALLEMDLAEIERLIAIYFDNMVAINLFHEPSFSDKLDGIKCPTQAAALLAAMFTFCARFAQEGEPQADTNYRASRFLNIALRLTDDALRECGDHTPPLCVLQAAILNAHCQLNQGVLGRAWRSLGTCVRLAYEMNLHLIDIHQSKNIVDVDRWCADEEKRRAWWAIWEMDVFATTIRRTPTAVAWSQMEVLLPVEDEYWFSRKPQPSCCFQRDPTRRWKALDASGNESPKAWFIVINSLMKEAQRISSPRGVPGRRPQSDTVDEARQRLEIIANAVRCFQLALPSHLKYKNQCLGFDARVLGEITSKRQAHCSIYNIHVMTQLARLMIYRYDVFKGRFRVSLPTRHDRDDNTTSHAKEDEHPRAKEYFDAADDILSIINRSSDDHVRYINPFLSSTIWLASAVNLMRSQLCRPAGALRSVLRSRYEVLHLTYKKCVSFWEMNTAVQQSLETLEEQVEMWQQQQLRAGVGVHDEQVEAHISKRRKETPIAPPNSAALEDHQLRTAALPTPPPYSQQFPASNWQPPPPQSLEDTFNAPILNPMPLIDTQPMDSQLLSSGTLIDPMFLFGSNPPLDQLLDLNGFFLDLESPGAGWGPPRPDLQDMF
ncbi:hypothetical protein BJX66DRAFT_348133 [Aspergillus keveii]|uniref:Xylanolytic transcriptional activator regulatory domain-containing protein n=1 Tax=Aspergillus keveii TaxID=714993 RepID=A0ABR4FNT0_9EURO